MQKKSRKYIFFITFLIFQGIYFSINPQEESEESTNLVNAENTETINAEAVTEAQKGKYDQAIKRFKKIVSLQDQNVAATYNNLGYTYLLSNDYQKAIENYRKAVERNPTLVPSLANLGKLLYQVGEYQEAIGYGEKVISLDPQNANVRAWLPDAYKKAADKRMFDLQNNPKAQAKQDEEKPGTEKETVKATKKPLSKIEVFGTVQFEWIRPTSQFVYYSPGTTIPFPLGLSADIWASPDIRITGDIKVPAMGLNLPYFISSEENINFLLHANDNYYGIGVYFSQANFARDLLYPSTHFIYNSDFPLRNDTKLGLVFGSQKEFNSFIFYTYPRYLFQDLATGPQSIEYDRALTKIEYRIAYPEDKKRSFIPWHFELGLGLKTNEYFVTEYNILTSGATVAHYFGVYDIYLDISFGKIQPVFDKIPFQLGFLGGARLYFQETDDTTPFTFGNGQGYFGFDSNGALAGNTFPTFKSISFLLNVYSRQMFFSKLVFMEKLEAELSQAGQPYHGYSATVSVSYTF